MYLPDFTNAGFKFKKLEKAEKKLRNLQREHREITSEIRSLEEEKYHLANGFIESAGQTYKDTGSDAESARKLLEKPLRKTRERISKIEAELKELRLEAAALEGLVRQAEGEVEEVLKEKKFSYASEVAEKVGGPLADEVLATLEPAVKAVERFYAAYNLLLWLTDRHPALPVMGVEGLPSHAIGVAQTVEQVGAVVREFQRALESGDVPYVAAVGEDPLASAAQREDERSGNGAGAAFGGIEELSARVGR